VQASEPGGEVRVGGKVKGGDSGPGVTAVSIKNQELSVSFKSSKSAGSVSQRVQLFSTSKGGLCRSGFKTTPSKKLKFQQRFAEFQILVSGFESNSSKQVYVKCCLGSGFASPAIGGIKAILIWPSVLNLGAEEVWGK
jgi:hypothetical protein